MAKIEQGQKDRMKVAVCDYLLRVNSEFVAESGHPLVAPTAINWLGDGIVTAAVESLEA